MESVRSFFRRHRRGCLTAATVCLILLLLGANILAAYLTEDNTLYGDLTPEGLYTLSDEMKATCASLRGDITVTFCADPDRLMGNYECRYVYVMAKQLEKEFDNIHVVTCDISQNPTAVNAYKTNSATVISADDVIISCGGRYRIFSADTFWTLKQSAEDNTDYYSFNGEYKMATAFLTVTSIVEPVVCFAYGHGEHVYLPENEREGASAALLAAHDEDKSAFYTLLKNAGLGVRYIDLDREEIPENCVLVVLDGPTEDYSAGKVNSITEKTALKRLHAFLADRYAAVMLFKDPTSELRNLEEFAADWGVSYEDGYYLRETPENSLADAENTRRKLIANLSTDESSVANIIYENLAALETAPRTVVADTGAVSGSWKNDAIGSSSTYHITAYYDDFFTTSKNARPVNITDGSVGEAGVYAMAGIAVRSYLDPVENVAYNSYFFGAATTALTSNTYLENRAYCNFDIMYTTVRFISRTDEYASLALGGTSLNSPSLGGKPLETVTLAETGNVKYNDEGDEAGYYRAVDKATQLSWAIVLTAVPLLASATVGAVLLIKRRNR